jgi:hypothetical protein
MPSFLQSITKRHNGNADASGRSCVARTNRTVGKGEAWRRVTAAENGYGMRKREAGGQEALRAEGGAERIWKVGSV